MGFTWDKQENLFRLIVLVETNFFKNEKYILLYIYVCIFTTNVFPQKNKKKQSNNQHWKSNYYEM